MARELLIPAAPTTYTLEITSACNSRCVGCGNVFDRVLGEMDIARWRSLLEKIAPYAMSLRITGGEPTLHHEFPALIAAVDALNVPFVLFTNGLWERTGDVLSVLDKCRNLDGLLISVHGPDQETHQAFAGIDSFGRIGDTVREATRARLTVNTNTVLTCYNQHKIGEIADLSAAWGARFAAFSRYYGPPTPVTNLSEAEFRQAARVVHDLRRQGKRVQFNNCVPVCFDRQHTKSCPACITHGTISPLGQVRPCTHAPDVLGDLFTTPITDIWQGPEAASWRARIPEACRACAEFERCRGACKAMAQYRCATRDPLMCQALQAPLEADWPTRVEMYALARPEPNYRMRREAFGYLLVNRNQIVRVGKDAKIVLDALDGLATLDDLRNRYGDAAVRFVVYLFRKGLVYLRQ